MFSKMAKIMPPLLSAKEPSPKSFTTPRVEDVDAEDPKPTGMSALATALKALKMQKKQSGQIPEVVEGDFFRGIKYAAQIA
jgi:hypothetical protein